MPKFIDMAGKKLHRLTFIAPSRKSNHGHIQWKCVCDCGKTVICEGANVRSGNTKSCGCLEREVMSHIKTTHGHTKGRTTTPTFRTWCAMWTRCTNPHQKDHRNYVDRGISVCARWEKFECFLADMGERPPGMTLDRINPDGNYELENCRWATVLDQARNRRKPIPRTRYGVT